ncbi:uncharacterized protein LOC117169980 [Belonocnema kinseyi]|uniref:uncharacterized protein LOC117169980 n=1 Tax=Belonocnema kinseyi TaxID=2817044 RepID=UPI00143D26F0|nr:uncharacterized protein LOC117169980 [Belonocnema kinseyi]
MTMKQKGDQTEKENDEIIRPGLQARFKQAQHKILEENFSSEDRDQEKERELQALAGVMKLLQDRKDLFPESSMDDLKQQLNLYRTQ